MLLDIKSIIGIVAVFNIHNIYFYYIKKTVAVGEVWRKEENLNFSNEKKHGWNDHFASTNNKVLFFSNGHYII